MPALTKGVPYLLKKFSRNLLASTCLTVAAAGGAHAATLTESTDFSNSLGAPTQLDSSIDTVIGSLNFSGDAADYFEFTGLTQGFLFTLNATADPINFLVYDPANTATPLYQTSTFPATFDGIVPASGNLIVGFTQNEGLNYQVSLTTAENPAPEPGTLGVAGVALASALTLRRKVQKS